MPKLLKFVSSHCTLLAHLFYVYTVCFCSVFIVAIYVFTFDFLFDLTAAKLVTMACFLFVINTRLVVCAQVLCDVLGSVHEDNRFKRQGIEWVNVTVNGLFSIIKFWFKTSISVRHTYTLASSPYKVLCCWFLFLNEMFFVHAINLLFAQSYWTGIFFLVD